jgi:uncharacterized HAD superfamily protein
MNLKDVILGIDLDHTLFLQVNHFIEHIQKHIDPGFSHKQWNKWDILEHFPEKRQELIQFLKTYYASSQNMHLMNGAKEFLALFSASKLFYITARSNWFFKDPYKETLTLLQENKLPLGKLILQVDPQTNKQRSKGQLAKEKGIQLFIEDNPTNALDIAKHCPVLLVDYQYNRHINERNIFRIGKFDDETGTWSINPWDEATKLASSGKLLQYIQESTLSKHL